MSDLEVSLLPWQRRVWEDPARFKVIAAGRRTGKSRYAALRALVKAMQSERGHIFYIAPTQSQARDIMWGMLLELGESVIKHAHINNMQVTLTNGSKISLKGADRPETMKGVSLAMVILDEYAEMKPLVWSEVIRPALADLKGEAIFIGTPLGRNHFWELSQHAGQSSEVNWSAYHFTSFDNPLLDPDEINEARKTMGSFAFKQEFEASFDAKGSALFKEEWIQFSEVSPIEGDVVMSIDPCGFKDTAQSKTSTRLDECCITVAKINDDGWYIQDMIVGRWTLGDTASVIFDAIMEYRPLRVGIERGIAQQALMSPLTDEMNARNRWFNVELLTHSNQKKTDRIVWALQGRLEHGKITFNKGPWNAQLLDQLMQFPSKLTHDDMVDSLAYVDQLSNNVYAGNLVEIDEWEPLDADVCGY